jgi:hypothetical protein
MDYLKMGKKHPPLLLAGCHEHKFHIVNSLAGISVAADLLDPARPGEEGTDGKRRSWIRVDGPGEAA